MHSSVSALLALLFSVFILVRPSFGWPGHALKRQANTTDLIAPDPYYAPSSTVTAAGSLMTCVDDDYATAFSENPDAATSLCSSLLCFPEVTATATDATIRRFVILNCFLSLAS